MTHSALGRVAEQQRSSVDVGHLSPQSTVSNQSYFEVLQQQQQQRSQQQQQQQQQQRSQHPQYSNGSEHDVYSEGFTPHHSPQYPIVYSQFQTPPAQQGHQQLHATRLAASRQQQPLHCNSDLPPQSPFMNPAIQRQWQYGERQNPAPAPKGPAPAPQPAAAQMLVHQQTATEPLVAHPRYCKLADLNKCALHAPISFPNALLRACNYAYVQTHTQAHPHTVMRTVRHP